MTMIQDFDRYQAGRETTRGTAVAATKVLPVPMINFTASPGQVLRPALARGVLVRNHGNEIVTRRGMTFTVPEHTLDLGTLPIWLSMGVKTYAAPSGAGPYVHTYERSLTADPAPTSWTLERRLTDASSPKDNEWAYCLASKLVWTWANDAVMFSVEGFGRSKQSSTLTAALSFPTVVEAPAGLLVVYIDDTWAGLGGTQVSNQVISARLEFNTGLTPIYTKDGRTDLDFTVYKPNRPSVNLTITALVGAQFDTEATKARAQAARNVKLLTTIDANGILELDCQVKYDGDDVVEVGEQDGQRIVTMNFVDTGDDLAHFFKCIVTNSLATL